MKTAKSLVSFLRTSNLISMAVATVLVGCQQPLDEAEEFRRGVPRQETVAVELPKGSGQASGQALTVESHSQALLGKTSDFFKLTAEVTTMINGGAILVGVLVKAVIAHPPTNVDRDTAVWGPFPGDDLEPLNWKVTIHRIFGHNYQYKFEAQPKGMASAAWVTILSGRHSAALDDGGDPIEGFGEGTFTLDWDARQTLPVPSKEVGKAHYSYARPAKGGLATIDAQFRQVMDEDNGRLIDVDYAYARQPGSGGNMDFTYTLPPQMLAQGAKWSVRSRWQATGAGRADVKAAGGDLPSGVTGTANECWGVAPFFLSKYLAASWLPGGGYGTEATDCGVFPTAEYSKL